MMSVYPFCGNICMSGKILMHSLLYGINFFFSCLSRRATQVLSSATLVALIELLTLMKLVLDFGSILPPSDNPAPAPFTDSFRYTLAAATLPPFGWQMSLATAHLIIHKSVRSVETFRQCK